MKEHLKSRAHKLREHYVAVQGQDEERRKGLLAGPSDRDEVRARMSDSAAMSENERSEFCEWRVRILYSDRCNRVLFVERSGEPQYQEWLSA